MNRGVLGQRDQPRQYLRNCYYSWSVGPGAVASSSITPTLNRLYFSPWVPEAPVAIDRLNISVATAASDAFWRVGIYDDDGYGRPRSLIYDAGQIDTSTTGGKDVVAVLTCERVLYWVAGVPQAVVSNVVMFSTNNTSYVSYVADLSGSVNQAYYQDGVSGSLPAVATLASAVPSQSAVRVLVRTA